MSSLQYTEKALLEKILGMRTGYVSDFSDRTFREFVEEKTGIDIYTDRYVENGTSKANRLKTFWKKESDAVITPLVEGLLDYAYFEKTSLDTELHVNEEKQFLEARKIVQRLKDATTDTQVAVKSDNREIEVLISDLQKYLARIDKGVVKAQEAEDFFFDCLRKAKDIFVVNADEWRLLDRWQNEAGHVWQSTYKSGIYADEKLANKIKTLQEKLVEIVSGPSSGDAKKSNGVPRIVHLKALYGDEFIDYIKDDVGVDQFLKDVFTRKEQQKREFLLNDKNVERFLKKWASFVHKYKNLYGQSVRDKDAISSLRKAGVLADNSLYEFRNKLLKADFEYGKSFVAELEENVKSLDEADSKLDLSLPIKDQKLIDSKLW